MYYNALVGICEEDAANSGGSPPAQSGVFFSNSQGGSQAIDPYMWRNARFSTGGFIIPFVSGIGTFLVFSSSPVHSQISSNEYKTDLTLTVADLTAFADAAIVGQLNPFAEEEEEEGEIIIINPGGGLGLGQNVIEEIFFNVATYLECPNGLGTLNRYEIDSVVMGWGGFAAIPVTNFITGGHGVGSNYPLQDSLAKTNLYPDVGGFGGAGFNGDWGICGTGTLGTATSKNTAQQPINIIRVADFRAKGFGTPAQGQTFTTRYKVEIVNNAGATETAFHTVVITLT